MTAWIYQISKDDLTRGELAPMAAPDLAEGDVLLAVERFAVTANNVTYGAMGDSFGYWKFFPAADGWGVIPVWGFATVVQSRAEDIPVGMRLFGYLPMASHWVARLARTRAGIVDTVAHRAELPPTYNQYAEAPDPTPGDDHRCLLRPLFGTSWLIDDFLESEGDFGAKSVILTSASSKTALGLAWRLHRRGVKVIGLTSPGKQAFLEGLGFFHQVLPYGEALDVPTPAVLVDFAGDPKVIGAVHAALGDRLVHSAIVGATHWQADRPEAAPLPGPAPTLFFAPDQIRKRSKEWGPEEFGKRFTAALAEFVQASPWLKLRTEDGPEGLARAWTEVATGTAPPDVGLIVKV